MCVCVGGGGDLYIPLSGAYIYIYTFTFSHLADTSIQSDLQVRTMEIYSLCIMCVCFCKHDLF